MLKVPIDKILPVTDARANISQLVDDVEKGDIYVLTRGGKPAVVVASIEYIKKLTEKDRSAESESKRIEEKNIDEKIDTNVKAENLPAEKSEITEEPAVYEEKQTQPEPYEEKQDLPQSIPVKVANNGWN